MLIWIIGAILALAGLAVYRRDEKKVAGMQKGTVALVLVILGVGLIALQLGYLEGIGISPLSAGVVVQGPADSSTGLGVSTYQPTGDYATKDKFSATSVSGTSYYKANGQPATTTAKTNTNPGVEYTYWVDNSSYYVKPVTKTAGDKVTYFVADAFANGTATVTGYDLVNRQSVSSGAYNTSMGANDQANIEFTYQGTAKQSAGPFGGVFVLETNSTISSVTCTGDQLLSDNPYHLTYSVTATSNTFRTWAYSSEMDDGSGSVRTIQCQFQNGATAVGAGSPYYAKFIPANYYVTNEGNIVLDTEKFLNDDTTRTGLGSVTLTSYWGA